MLCWIGYQRPISKECYYWPLQKQRPARGSTRRPPSVANLQAQLHRAIPEPKPTRCPMDDAERRLIAALRAGELRAIEHDFKNNRSLELPVSAFDYAVIVSTRGGLEIDNAASDDDGMRASTQPTRQNLMFFTREVMTTFGSDRTVDHSGLQRFRNWERRPEIQSLHQ